MAYVINVQVTRECVTQVRELLRRQTATSLLTTVVASWLHAGESFAYGGERLGWSFDVARPLPEIVPWYSMPLRCKTVIEIICRGEKAKHKAAAFYRGEQEEDNSSRKFIFISSRLFKNEHNSELNDHDVSCFPYKLIDRLTSVYAGNPEILSIWGSRSGKIPKVSLQSLFCYSSTCIFHFISFSILFYFIVTSQINLLIISINVNYRWKAVFPYLTKLRPWSFYRSV